MAAQPGERKPPPSVGGTTETDLEPTTDALVVRRSLRARTESGEVYVESMTTSWLTADAARTRKGAVGVAPGVDLLWRRGEGTWWIFKESYCPWFGFTDGRGHISQELRIDRGQDGELRVPDPVLTQIAEPWAAPEKDGLVGSSVYRIGPDRDGLVTRVWVSTDTPLSGRDFADELRRRLAPPWSADLERLFAAFEQLPGYPVAFSDGTSSYAVVGIDREAIASAELELPKDKQPTDRCTTHLAAEYFADYEARRAAGRERWGLDEAFSPTPGQPFPPELPGGSCKPDPATCIEAFNGVETTFVAWCDVASFDFHAACPRDGLLSVCESPDRDALLYRYESAAAAQDCPEGMRRYVLP